MVTKFSLLILLSFQILLNAQSSESTWQKVDTRSEQNIYIDLKGLQHYTGDDIYVWVLENFDEPTEIDGSESEVLQTKTYYLFNRELKKYSILEIIYFNEDGAITDYFNYWRNLEVDAYKYNYPIVIGSNEETIFEVCVKYIDKATAEEN